MKKYLALFLAVIMMFSAGTVLAATEEEPEITSIFNGGFERGMVGWGYDDRSDGKKATIEISEENPHSGEKCLHINSSFYSLVVQGSYIIPGETYKAVVYMRGSGTMALSMEFSGEDTQFIEAANGPEFAVSNNNKWTEFIFNFAPPKDAASVNIIMLHTGGEVWYDDIELQGKVSERNKERIKNYTLEEEKEIVKQELLASNQGNLVPNNSYEELDENGNPVGVQCYGGWDAPYVEVQSKEARTGKNAIKVASVGDDAQHLWASWVITHLQGAAEYEVSLWFKGELRGDTKFLIITETYWNNRVAAGEGTGQPTTAYTESCGDWTKLTHRFELPNNSNTVHLVIGVHPAAAGGAEVYFDDVEMKMVGITGFADISTDKSFYYDGIDKLGVATVNFMQHYEKSDYTVDFKLTDGNKVLAEELNVPKVGTKANFVYPVDLLAEIEKPYYIEAVIKNSKGEQIGDVFTWDIYKWNKPTCLNEKGQFIDENGEIFVPTTTYHIDEEDWEKCASAGINVILWHFPETKEEAIRQLDKLHSLGMKALALCFWGMKPAGHEWNYERVGNAIKWVVGHPAIWAYCTADEPYAHDTKEGANEDLKASYKMIHELDPDKIVTHCEAGNYVDGVKYSDGLIIDTYPGDWGDYGKKVGDATLKAYKEHKAAGKPIFSNLLQVFLFHTTRPEPHELHQMIYQNFMAGAQGTGYYSWIPDGSDKTPLDKGIYWDTIMSYKEYEYDIVNKHFSGNDLPFSSMREESAWYETWVDGDVIYAAVINREDADTTVNVSLTSDNGKVTVKDYDIETVTEDRDLSAVTVGEGSFTTVLPTRQAVLYKITPKTPVDFTNATAYADMDNYSWALDAYEKMFAERVLIKDVDSVHLYPDKKITRAEFAGILIRTIGEYIATTETFSDVDLSDDYALEISVGKALEILKGVGEDEYNPDAEISRQDLMVICARGMRLLKGVNASGTAALDIFSDKDSIADYAAADVAAMVELGIVKGNADGTVNPLGNTTFAEAVVIMSRILNWKNL